MDARVAMPGDADLDIDVDGLSLTSVTRVGCEFIITATGGFGKWQSSDSETMVDVDSITDLELVFGSEMEPGYEYITDAIEEWLGRWYETSIPLRLVGAPGKYSLLIADCDEMIPIPRSE